MDHIGLRKVIFAICFCLVLLLLSTTTTVRVWASPSESHLRTIESQAHIDYESGKYLPAIFLLKQLLKIYPKDTGLMTDLASAEGELSNYTGALSLYKKRYR